MMVTMYSVCELCNTQHDSLVMAEQTQYTMQKVFLVIRTQNKGWKQLRNELYNAIHQVP